MLLLLSVAGIGKTFAYDFYAIIDNQIWGAFNYVDQEQHTVEVAKGLNEANVTIPSTVTYNNVEYTVVGIGEKAFYVSGNKSKLVSVTIPNTVTYIAKEGFYYCRKLTSIEIPASVTSIGELAFHLCDQLTSITFATPSSLASIGEKAFSNCHVLAAVTIPSSVTSISELPFYSCIGLSTITVDAGNTVYDSRDNCNAIIETATNTLVVGCKNSTIPSTVTAIGASAFEGCTTLTAITIPNSVVSIGNRAFYYCNDLENNTGLETIVIPNSVISIGDEAFSCCYLLATVSLGNGLETIGASAFDGCWPLESITIPNSVLSIGDGAFASCGSLAYLSLGNSVETIGEGAFGGCSSLTSFTLPASVTFVGEGVLRNCSALTEITVDEGNTAYDSRDNCNALIETATNTLLAGCNNTVIPSGITAIGASAFEGCNGLTSIVLPNTLETIGEGAFSICRSLTSITIPTSVTSIGYFAFLYCNSLTTLNMLPVSVPLLGSEYDFYYSPSVVIYVPYESLEAYQTATYWSSYANKMQPMAYKSVAGYGTGNGNWAFVASPLATNTAPDAVGIENMITEADYDLYRFNQSAVLEWENYKQEGEHYHFDLANGQGYLYANVEDVNVMFKGEFNEEETKEVGLVYDANATFAGWNLVGNPFPVSAYANKSYYVMNEEGSAIEPVAVSMGTAIPFCTGMMVKADNTGETVTFSKTAPETAVNQGVLQIAVAQANTRGNAVEDKAIVSFNAGDRLEKFVFNEDNATLSIPQGGKDFAIANAEKMGEMPLNFKAAKNGEYTITVNPEAVEMDYLHLIDNMTGADIDLLALRHPSTGSGSEAQGPAFYTFNAKTTDYTSRFRLVFVASSVFGDEDGDDEAFAFYSNGNYIVTNEGEATLQIIDELGHILSSEHISGSVSKAIQTTPGIYVIRLLDGNNVRTQKIVVR